MAKKEKGERSIIAPKGGRIVHTGRFRLPDGTIRTMPELGMTNVKTPTKMEEGGAVRGGGSAISGTSFRGVR